MTQKQSTQPDGDLAIRTLAMPANTNPNGDIFGGWVVSNMDLAGLSIARQYTKHPVVTVAINSMEFISPVLVGDFICCYAKIIKIGHTSLQIKIETWSESSSDDQVRKVTEGVFTYVAIDQLRRPTPIKSQPCDS